MKTLDPSLLELLRQQIGSRGTYDNNEYELIEVLEHDAALVLRDCGGAQSIQSDMHGEAHRIVAKTHTVPVISEVEHDLHPVLRSFFAAAIVNQLRGALG